MSFYKHGNGRIVPRASNGRFRQSSLAQDFNLGTRICPDCGALNPYELATFRTVSGFVEKVKNEPPTLCNQCGSSLQKTADL